MPADVVTTPLKITLQGKGNNPNEWGDIANANFSTLESAITGNSQIAVTGGSLNLTDAQNVDALIEFTGTLTSNQTIVTRTAKKIWFIKNSTAGAFSLTVKTAAGTGIVVPQGQGRLLYCDGTNVVNAAVSNESAVADGSFVYVGQVSGTANALTATSSIFKEAALTDGMKVRFKAASANTDTPSLNLTNSGGSALGAVDIVDAEGVDLRGGTFAANGIYEVIYNSTLTKWQLSAGGGAGGANGAIINTATNITITESDNGKTYNVDSTGGDRTVSFDPAADLADGFRVTIMKAVAANNVILDPNGAETIDDAATLTLEDDNSGVEVGSNGTALFITGDGNYYLNGSVQNKHLANMALQTLKGAQVNGAPIDVTLASMLEIAAGALQLKAFSTAYDRLSQGTIGERKVLSSNPTSGTIELFDIATGNQGLRIKGIHSRSNGSAGGLTRSVLLENNDVWVTGSSAGSGNGNVAAVNIDLCQRLHGIPAAKSVTKIVEGDGYRFALTDDGKVYAQGENSQGALGIGNTTDQATFVQVTALDAETVVDVVTTGARASTQNTSFFIINDGTVYSAGADTYGQLGQGATPADATTATEISGLTNVSSIAVAQNGRPHVLAVLSDGTMRSWGYNASGQLGLGNLTDQDTPQIVAGPTGVVEALASCGASTFSFSLIRKSDGSLMACGDNTSGQLGQGDLLDLDVFTAITFTPSATISKISITGEAQGNCAAVDTAGNLWCWGDNARGQLGDGGTADRSTPYKPSVSEQGSIVDCLVAGSAGSASTYYRTATAIYAAGYSTNGNLGTNSTLGTNDTFAEVVGLDGEVADWSVSGQGVTNYGLTVLTLDGRVLTCGSNLQGQCGIGLFNDIFFLRPMLGFALKADTEIPTEFIMLPVGDETTALTIGTGKFNFRMPYPFEMTDIKASVGIRPTLSKIVVDVNRSGTSIMTTDKLEIDPGLGSTKFSATQPALTTTIFNENDEIEVDIDQIGSGTAGAGLKVYLIGKRIG